MTYFILQTLFWLLAAFVIGLVLGRWIKRLLCKESKPMAQSYDTEQDSTPEASYTSTADRLALRSAKDDAAPSQPIDTVNKSGSSLSAGTAALGAATVGIAGHVASQALSDNEVTTEKVEPVDTPTTVADIDDVKSESIVNEEGSVESLNVDTSIVDEVEEIETETFETHVKDNLDITKDITKDALDENLEAGTSILEETTEIGEEAASDVIEGIIGGEIEENIEESIEDNNELLSKGVAAAGAAAAGIAGHVIADDKDESVANEEDSVDGLDVDDHSSESDVNLEHVDTNIIEKSEEAEELEVEIAETNIIEEVEELEAEITETNIEESTEIDDEIISDVIADDTESEIEESIEENIEDGNDLLSKGIAAAGVAAAGITSHVIAADDEDESGANEEDSADILDVDDQTPETDVSLDHVDTNIIEEVAELESEITETSIEDTTEIIEVDEEAISDAIGGDTKGEIGESIEENIEDGNDLLSKGIAAAGVATAGIAGSVIAGNEGEGITNEEDTPSSSYLDSILAEGASVIAGIESSNLRIIEGIGKKMEGVLHDNDIHTWKDLSMKSDSDIRDILDKYDDKYKGVELDGWVEQASLLADGKVDELITLQKQDGLASQLEDWLENS